MSDHSSTSEQRAQIVPPRTASEVDAVLPAASRAADLQEASAVDTGGVQLEKPKPYGSYEEWPEAVRSEFEELIASRAGC